MNLKKTKLILFGLAFIFCLGFHMISSQATDNGIRCQTFNVPFSIPEVPEGTIYGELCWPQGENPSTVLFLVHSTWYNHGEWDPPQKTYSYVHAAVKRGYATFAIDRLGTGRSTHPPSGIVTPVLVVDALHKVIQALRNGDVGDRPFSKVVWIGSSFGSEYGWINADRYPGDVDAFILNGLLHFTKESFTNDALGQWNNSVCDDPIFKFIESDCGYITNKLGKKGDLYYYIPEAAPGMLQGVDDYVLRDMVSGTLLAGSVLYVGVTPEVPTTPFVVDPETSPSRSIHVPTLINLGDRDQIVCGPPDGVPCTHDFISNFETPYFGVTPDVYIAPKTGHALTLHKSAPTTFKVMNDWLDDNVGN